MFAIAPTDLNWFRRLSEEPFGRRVNFWTPTPWGVRKLQEGDRLYFMLKAPVRKVGGYGVFARYAEMTAAAAWDEYGPGNGVDSKVELVQRIEAFALKNSKGYVPAGNPVIGCIELTDVVMLDEDRYLDPAVCGHPFPSQIVKLKYFGEFDGIAAHLGTSSASTPFAIVTAAPSHKPSRRKDRKGQSAFRQQVLRNYGHRCCVYGETVLELLEAAHIQPYVNEQSNHEQNGLCLRVDLHRLFDEGLISVTDELTLMVSKRLDGSSYAELNGAQLAVPPDPHARPSLEALALHRTNLR